MGSRPAHDRRAFRRIHGYQGSEIDLSAWPETVPAVAQILRGGLELAAGVTVLIGENGSGKSTVVEVIAEACGLNPQGGSARARYRTRDSEPGVGERLWAELSAVPPTRRGGTSSGRTPCTACTPTWRRTRGGGPSGSTS